MKNTTKLISALLTVMLLLGAFTNLIVFEASAAGDKKSPDEILAENVNAYIKDKVFASVITSYIVKDLVYIVI